MRWLRSRSARVPIWVVVVACAVLYVVTSWAVGLVAPGAGPVVQLLLLLVAVGFVLRPWWLAAGSRRSATDPPQRVLEAVVAVLPERRRQWGRAMIAELAGIEGRSARWRFALSCVRATLGLRPAGGWSVLALVAGVVVAAIVTAGPVVGAAVPGLGVFAAIFTGAVGALVVLAVARSRRPRLSPVPAVLVTGGVAAAIAVTVIFLRREPAAAEYLPPAVALYLAAVLAGCLWMALGGGTNRLASHLGAGAGVVFAAWWWLVNLLGGTEPPLPLVLLLVPVIVGIPIAVFVVPAFVAGRAGRSLGLGLRAAGWTATAMMPLTYAVFLPAALRRHEIDGRSWDGEVVVPVGAGLADAMIFCLGIFPVLCLMFGVLGAGLGARANRPPARTEAQLRT